MPLRPTTILRGVPIALGLALLAAGCGGQSDLAAECGDVITEELDPTGSVHLLPGAPPPDYLSDPPTSGPHLAAEPVTGAVDDPLENPAQITVLETGGVLVQYRPDDITDSERDRLVRLAGAGVVVAPNPDMAEPVVATAWLRKQSCQGAAVDALAAFADEQGGRGPGADG